MSDSTSVHVPHLGGIDAAYKMPYGYVPAKPTLVLVSPYALSLDTFDLQFTDNALTETANLLAIDHIGQGRTRCKETDAWSFWDTATMNLQVLDGLRIGRVFLLGTAQGAWVCMRMALLEPDRVALIPAERVRATIARS
jgi:pimeloyl-ACP methyl ester carboxylesterase